MQSAQVAKPATTTTTTKAPVMLVPALVESMIAARQAAHVAKFRTTCTDCVPNY